MTAAAKPAEPPKAGRTINGKSPEQIAQELAAPFPQHEIEWRFQASGVNDKGPWARILAYITNRGIMERLDAVLGIGNWQNEFRPWELGTDKGSLGVLCGIGIRFDDGEWVWKWDGAEQPKERGGGDTGQPVAVKGGFSASMKRAGAELGIGRYLYHLDSGWARFHPNGEYENKIEKVYYKWSPPKLPAWALPGGSGKPERRPVPEPAVVGANTPASGEQRPAPQPTARGGGPQQPAAEPKADAKPFYPQGKFAPSQKQVDLYRKILQSHVWTEAERLKAESRLKTKRCTREEIGKWIDGMTAEVKKRKDAEKREKGEPVSADDALERSAIESED